MDSIAQNESGGKEVKLSELRSVRGSAKTKKRAGRGVSSGRGKTCGRGQKGQKSRSGGGKGPGFEGGQNPLHKRLPKLPGFKNPDQKEFQIVNVERLNTFKASSTITPEVLAEKGIVKRRDDLVKFLGRGKIEKSYTVKAHGFSQSAKQKIEKAGGKTEVLKTG